MARKPLRSQLNQIRAWVRQGRTDAWIAHQLEVSTAELREFRAQHGLAPDEEGGGAEVDLRDEIEAEIEAAAAKEEAEPVKEPEPAEEPEEGEAEEPEEGKAEARPRRRRRRGRRGARRRDGDIEGTFDHGEREGFGIWLDPAVKDNPTYAEHWAGHREVTISIEPERIVIRRSEG